MQILVVSGFLGAGKTTFIRELVRKTGRDFVIYENEYGQADIDAAVLRDDAELEVWESVENCICCTGKQDFASSVLTIFNTLAPDYLIVEPTGVAKLESITDNISRIGLADISLLAPVTVVDAQVWQRQRSQHADIFDNQVAYAASVVVSKAGADFADAELEGYVARCNADAELVMQRWEDIDASWWEGLLKRNFDGTISESDQNDTGASVDLESFSICHAELPTENHLIWLLDALSSGVFGKIDRAKGYLKCGSQWLRFDQVDRAWAITGTEVADESRCVFIGRDLYRNGLREVFVPVLWRDRADITEHHHHESEEHGDHAHGHDHDSGCDHGHGPSQHHGHGFDNEHLHDHHHDHSHEHDDAHLRSVDAVANLVHC